MEELFSGTPGARNHYHHPRTPKGKVKAVRSRSKPNLQLQSLCLSSPLPQSSGAPKVGSRTASWQHYHACFLPGPSLALFWFYPFSAFLEGFNLGSLFSRSSSTFSTPLLAILGFLSKVKGNDLAEGQNGNKTKAHTCSSVTGHVHTLSRN